METTVEVKAQLTSQTNAELVVEVKVPLVDSMLYGEEIIQAAVNAVGMLATQSLLKRFDTDGSPLRYGSIVLTSKGEVEKEYETPYGKVSIERHVYQSAQGGDTFCPLDDSARIIRSATPKLSKMIANKYTRSSADEVKADFSDNHGRSLSRGQIQRIADEVGAIAIEQQSRWRYRAEVEEVEVSTVALGVDGAMMLMREDGYRQAMSGTIAFYNAQGKRLHTDYVATAPEYGKSTFFNQMSDEIAQLKDRFPQAHYVAIADGASDNWQFLEQHTTTQITDFYHASEYLTQASQAIFKSDEEKARIEWLEQHCHDLKHHPGAVSKQLKELRQYAQDQSLSAANLEKLNTTITYFNNQSPRMNYADYQAQHLPIGSGVTEAACKVTIKQRLCRSGMRWKYRGASIVLALRSLVQSQRWNQFWHKLNQFGVPACA